MVTKSNCPNGNYVCKKVTELQQRISTLEKELDRNFRGEVQAKALNEELYRQLAIITANTGSRRIEE